MLTRFISPALLLLLSVSCFAQVTSSELSGSVTDPSGGSLASAKVVATNVGTGRVHETVSNATGAYVIPLLPPGEYTVSAEATGFKKTVQKGLSLQVNQQATLDFKLEVGQVSDSVEVTAAAPLLESESSSLGTVINENLVNQLPLNGRNFVQLAILSPGVNGVGF